MSKDQSSYVINGEPVFKWSKIEFGLGKLSLDVIWFLGLSILTSMLQGNTSTKYAKGG